MTKVEHSSYHEWARHFGKSTLDADLIARFRTAGFAQPPVIGRDDVHASADIGALTVNIMDPDFWGYEGNYGSGVGILVGIAIHLKDFGDNGYPGSLPFSIEHHDTRETLRLKLGEPTKSNDGRYWDQWMKDGFKVTATYSKDFSDLMTLTVFLPEEE